MKIMNKNMKTYPILVVILFLMPFANISGQINKGKVTIEVIDASGKPIPQATIFSSKNRDSYQVNQAGKATIQFKANDQLKIVAKGYSATMLAVSAIKNGRVTLIPDDYRNGDDDKIYTLYGETTERRSVGAYSKVDGKALESNPNFRLFNSLSGRLNGLFTMDNHFEPGSSSTTSFVRAPYGDYIILVDGVERSINYIDNEIVESVQLLKDASLKSLYGGVQANGILMIKTKRGAVNENYSKITIESGVQMPTRLPQYLNSYNYTMKYNEAMQNSGLTPYYTPEDYINGDPITHPDVDYYKTFLNDNMHITKANGQFTGGSDNTAYFVHFGFQSNGGYEKFTNYPNTNEAFIIRGNIDNKVLDIVTVKAGFNAAVESKKWLSVNPDVLFDMLSDNRPNEFPIEIPASAVGRDDVAYVLGGTASNQNNPLGYLTQNGYRVRDFSYMQTDLTFDVDLNKWVKGLKFTPSFSFDVYNYLTSAQGASFVVYEPIPGNDTVTFNQYGEETKETSLTRGSINRVQRNFAYNITATYNNKFGKNDINMLLTYYQQAKQYDTEIQDMTRMTFGGLINYMYDNKYTLEASVNRVGVGTFSPEKRFGTFPTVGAGWIISDEAFMNESGIDYLKLRASYGILGYTSYTSGGIVEYNLYKDQWGTGSYGGGAFNNSAYLSRMGNPALTFQKSKEFNIGVDMDLLKKSLTISAGYFNNVQTGVFATTENILPGVLGLNGIGMYENYKVYLSNGFEFEAFYSKNVNDWNIQVGTNLTYGKSHITRDASPVYQDGYEGLNPVTTYGDILGLKAIGTFPDEAAIGSAPKQLYGPVLPGDIQYANINSDYDNVIDNKDRVVIGNSLPSIQYGITLSVDYKGINLDIVGYGLAGFDRLLNNKYYQIHSNRKYSEVLNTGLPNGNAHPVLRAEYSYNNFLTSDYWIVDGSFFKIRNAEIGYTFPKTITNIVGLNNVKIYARGANLFTLSKIKDLDPENLNAGLSNFPLFTTISGGISLSF
jgi:TonB-linked SusC/RagA family outer membrane protein